MRARESLISFTKCDPSMYQYHCSAIRVRKRESEGVQSGEVYIRIHIQVRIREADFKKRSQLGTTVFRIKLSAAIR
jgi:hypothetical protein